MTYVHIYIYLYICIYKYIIIPYMQPQKRTWQHANLLQSLGSSPPLEALSCPCLWMQAHYFCSSGCNFMSCSFHKASIHLQLPALLRLATVGAERRGNFLACRVAEDGKAHGNTNGDSLYVYRCIYKLYTTICVHINTYTYIYIYIYILIYMHLSTIINIYIWIYVLWKGGDIK